MKKRNIAILLFISVFMICIFSYSKIPHLFFQQDEIYGFGLFIKEGWSIVARGFLSSSVRHFVPVTMSFSYFIYSIFGMNYIVYNSVGLLFHLINGILIYFIARHFLKKKVFAIAASLIFFSSSVAAQFIMWPVISLNSISLTFSLFAWLAVINKRFFWLPILFLLAVFSVEYSAGLILFIPLAVFIDFRAKLKEKLKVLTPFLVVAFGYSLLRLLPILLNSSAESIFARSEGSSFILSSILHVPRYFAQLFFGQDILLFISRRAQDVFGLDILGTAYAETNIFPIISLILGLALIVLFILFIKKKYFVLPISFIFFGSLPFLLVPGGEGTSSVIASRYMYFGVAGMTLVIAFLLEYAFVRKKKIWFTFLSVFIIFLATYGTYSNYTKANGLYELGKTRLKILNFVKSVYPTLPRKVVFYTESSKSYYGLPEEEKIMPFQSGFGQTLIVFYSQNDKLTNEFYPGDYLWEIKAEGYREFDSRGFGYFRDLEKLKKVVEDYNIPKDGIIAFSWNGETQKLKDISVDVRKEISK